MNAAVLRRVRRQASLRRRQLLAVRRATDERRLGPVPPVPPRRQQG